MRETTVDLLTELNSALEARRIPYVDLASTLRGAPGIRYAIDPHCNAHGHELIGALAPLIRERFDLARRNPGPDTATLERNSARMRADGSELLRRPATSFVVTWLGLQAPGVLGSGRLPPLGPSRGSLAFRPPHVVEIR